jgi:hypothetical protein
MASDQPGGFAPLPPVGGPSLEDEERAMKSGRGPMLAAAAFAVLAVAGGLAWFVSSSGPNEYGELGRQVNGMRSQYFDGFWACAMPREDVRDLNSPDELKGLIARFSRSASGYARILREDCMHLLEEHRAPLDAVVAAPGLGEAIGRLSAALTALTAVWQAYVAFLATPELAFDAEDPETDRMITEIVQRWIDYRGAIREINDVVREHVTE